jgi:LacI family transcriptional regulator
MSKPTRISLPQSSAVRERRIPHVAVLIETSRGYGRGLLEGVARFNREHGPWSMFFEPHGLNDPPPKWLSAWKGDGILARINDYRMARVVRATGLPVVDVRGRLTGLGLPFIGVNNREVARLAVDHLLGRGFRHFGFCGLARGEQPHMDQRRDFFSQFVEAAGLPCQHFEPQRGRPWEEAQEHIADWLVQLPKPVGVMTCNDDRGHQTLDACRRAGVPVPTEVALVGVDNDTVLCNMADPPMSSIDVNPEQVGYEAAALLDRLMQQGQPRKPAFIELPPRGMVVRQSSDVLAIADPEVSAAVRFIRDHACAGLSVAAVSQHVAVSQSVLERRFKAILHRTPKHEILRVQLDQARRLLCESHVPIDVIAKRCGFATYKYFGDVFFREVGMRPGAYRKRYQHFA